MLVCVHVGHRVTLHWDDKSYSFINFPILVKYVIFTSDPSARLTMASVMLVPLMRSASSAVVPAEGQSGPLRVASYGSDGVPIV